MLKPLALAVVTAVLMLVVVVATGDAQSLAPTPHPAAVNSDCHATLPNGSTPPGERPTRTHHGNGSLWTVLWPEGTVVFRPGGPGFVLEDGSLQMKFPWWRGLRGRLVIEGRRLDAGAAPLRAHIPAGYGASGFQATGVIFPTPGCWEVTGHLGDTSLSFVVNVVKIGSGPVQNGLP